MIPVTIFVNLTNMNLALLHTIPTVLENEAAYVAYLGMSNESRGKLRYNIDRTLH